MLITRRNLVAGVAAVASVSAAKSPSLVATSAQDLGPFYPVVRPSDHDADLTRLEGRSGTAMGQPIQIIGRVVDIHGGPIANAQVELWQCNAAGRYAHPGDRANPAALDPNFQGFARLASDRDGEFKFRSVKPKDYDTPIGRRTPHIHFAIDGHAERLVTQMYFPNEPLNDIDFLLKNAAPRESVIAEAIDRLSSDPQALAYRWTVVLGVG
ncbi:MAG TPA: protocatechuate 3,4-dioxygenase [Sphingomicrobium sp.]|nr:protocatechuate 3,4-dioxygenase [Sphingomicrobium sp.]